MRSKSAYLLLSLFAIPVLLSGCGNSEEESSNVAPKPEKSVQKVPVSLNLSKIAQLSEGDTLTIMSNDTDERFDLVIRRTQETIPGIMSISANVNNQQTGLATLIYREGQLSGFMDMYESKIRWQVNFDSTDNGYYLTEIDPEDIDEMEGGEALSPPNEEY